MYYKKENPHGGAGEKNIFEFSASVNPLGPPRAALDAAKTALEEIDRYPDPSAEDLVGAIAEYDQVPRDYIICGNGASEIIYTYCAAHNTAPHKPARAIEISPTFAEYEAAVRAFGGELEHYICKEESGFIPGEDFFGFLTDARSDALFICNPNNPTGRLLPREYIEEVLIKTRELGMRVFIDECFMDLADSDWSSKEFLSEYPNLFILKAFTKTFAMPGIRLGYGLCADEDLLKNMSEVAPPWNVSAIAQAAGIAACKELGYIKEARKLIAAEREYLTGELTTLGFTVIPSDANFILFRERTEAKRAEEIASAHNDAKCSQATDAGKEGILKERLVKRGIAIRSCKNFPGLGKGWYRIAVRNHEENQVLIEALRAIATERI